MEPALADKNGKARQMTPTVVRLADVVRCVPRPLAARTSVRVCARSMLSDVLGRKSRMVF